MKGKAEPVSVRFWYFVQKGEDCWSWSGTRNGGGYGLIKVCGQMVGAHRISFELANGPIPAGVWVLHRCDNPGCTNPEHLYLGDRSRNMKDARERGRIDMKKVASAPRPGARKAG